MKEFEDITLEALIGSVSLAKTKHYMTILLYDDIHHKVEVYTFNKWEELKQYCDEFVENMYDGEDTIEAKGSRLYNAISTLEIGESYEITTEESQTIIRLK